MARPFPDLSAILSGPLLFLSTQKIAKSLSALRVKTLCVLRVKIWGTGNGEREDSAYSAAPREKTDPSTNYQLTNYKSTNYQKQTKGTSGETPYGERGMENGEGRNRPQGKNDQTTNLRQSTQIKKRAFPISRLKICDG